MQYWIIYQPGVGGDGFANLLEHACNVRPADGILEWRIHYRVEDRVKFYSCAWAPDPRPFRKRGICDTELNPNYINCVETGQNTIIPVHYFYWDEYKLFKHKEIINKNQLKIHLYSSDPARSFRDSYIKNLKVASPEKYPGYCYEIKKELKRPDYHCHIDIEQVWTNWSYLEEQLKSIGIELKQEVYHQYMEFINA